MTQVPHQKYLDDYESGPRPPVPGQESRMYKMTEGQSSSCSQNSPPSFCKWNKSLTCLLEDAEGAEIFKKYVETCGEPGNNVHADRLNFYFASEGLKQQSDVKQTKQMAKVIYKFLLKSQISIPEDLHSRIRAGLKSDAKPDPHIFDLMQQDIVRIIIGTTYPSFLQSDLYIQHRYNAEQSSTSSSGSCSAPNLPRTSTLPTLHEDTELSISDSMAQVAGSSDEKPHVRLTKNLLLATQERRLELRPQGAHGYIASFSSSYNPVSRQDSERQSCSSGGVTDSDTKSVSSSRDGRPHYRRQSENRQIQQHAQLNKETNSIVQVPRTHRTNEHLRSLNENDLWSVLLPKLEAIKRDQDMKEKLNQMINEEGDSSGAGGMDASGPSRLAGRLGPLPPIPPAALTDDIFRKLQVDDDNDQSILDQHVSRVWSDLTPHRSPGTASPCPAVLRQRSHDAGIGSDISSIGGQSMRHSRSMPEHSSSRRLTHKWSSVNTDSGISMYSLDPPIKSRDATTSRSRSMGIDTTLPNTAFLEEARRRLVEDETNRKSRRHSQYPQTAASLPPMVSGSQESTVAVYTFLDEKTPYKLKLPGTQPTLRQFKDYLPKKGSFRFFFKTACEDPDNPVIQEEIVNDMDILPLFDKKVMGLIKPYE